MIADRPEAPSATLRDAAFADRDRVETLLREFGMGVARRNDDVERWWDWMWVRNPALDGAEATPPGWLLEAEGEVVGFFGSLPARYWYGEERLRVAIASHWAVQRPYRSCVPELATSYFENPRVDLLLVTTGIAATGRIFGRYGASPMPFEDYRNVLYWIADPEAFVRAALARRSLPEPLAAAVPKVARPLLDAWLTVGKRRPGRHAQRLEPERIGIGEVGDEFDELWRRKLREGRLLLACRRAESLRWHFDVTASDRVEVLRCRRGGKLEGYAVLLRESVDDIGLERLKIVDLLVAGDDPEVVDALLAAAWERTQERRSHALEWVGFSGPLRERAKLARPFSRAYEVMPVHYKARRPELSSALQRPDVWYPTLYDGDGTLSSIRD